MRRSERRSQLRSIFAVVAAAMVFGLAPGAAAAARYERGACAFEGAAGLGPGVECGTLFVPEDRARPERRELRLAVAVLRATGVREPRRIAAPNGRRAAPSARSPTSGRPAVSLGRGMLLTR